MRTYCNVMSIDETVGEETTGSSKIVVAVNWLERSGKREGWMGRHWVRVRVGCHAYSKVSGTRARPGAKEGF